MADTWVVTVGDHQGHSRTRLRAEVDDPADRRYTREVVKCSCGEVEIRRHLRR